MLLGSKLNAQNTVGANNLQTELQLNTITTAVPFLLISPDARGGALGETGVSTSPDENSIHWNPAKLAFTEGSGGLSLTYSPWLRSLVSDLSLSYVSGYYRIDKRSVAAASLRYFSLGDITFTNSSGQVTGNFTPNEYAVDFAYGLQLSEQFSFGMALRYINSNLTNGQIVQGQDTRPGRSVAADVSAYYFKDDLTIGDYDGVFRAGVNFSNIGAKMSYTNDDEDDFLPANMKIGSSLTLDFDDYNSMTFIGEVNKLLVPTPPIFLTNSDGDIIRDSDGNATIVSGKDPNVSVVSGVFGSFSDAPGVVTAVDPNGDNAVVESGSIFREEVNELTLSTGVEYWYDKQFAVRLGYFFENPNKGNRQYLTVGLGFKLSVFGADFAYTVGNSQQNPLANTVRVSLKFRFDDFASQNDN